MKLHLVKSQLIVAAALLACGTACGGGLTTRDAVNLADRRIDRALSAANEELANPAQFDAPARFAPVACACPAWEVWYGGAWQRVALRPARELQTPEVDALIASGGEPDARYAMTLTTSRDVEHGGDGWAYSVLEVIAISAEP